MKDNLTKIKNHIKEHKKEYLIGVAGIAGIIVTYFVASNRKEVNALKIAMAKGWKPQSTFIDIKYETPRTGRPGDIVRCKETGQIWPSIKDTANEIGVAPTTLGQHLNNRFKHWQDINGYHYEKLVPYTPYVYDWSTHNWGDL